MASGNHIGIFYWKHCDYWRGFNIVVAKDYYIIIGKYNYLGKAKMLYWSINLPDPKKTLP